MEVHQVLPALDIHDAVSNDALEIKRVLESNGYVSEIYSLHVSPKLAAMRQPLEKLSDHVSRDAVIIYHYSIKSEVPGILKPLPNKKILIYHNITPAYFFKDYDEDLYRLCRDAKDVLGEIKDDYQLGLGDSEFNRIELEKFGFKNTGVLPVFISLDKGRPFNPGLYNKLTSRGLANIIFVGRLAPNKKQDDVIKAFYYYHKYINPGSRLYIIGKDQVQKYARELKATVGRLGLADSVVFTGAVAEKDLTSYYKAAGLFLCMSEHEGFCVPLLEAMSFDVPVLAYSSTGVPYTLGCAGILFDKKDYVQVAEMMGVLISDNGVRDKVIERQRLRLRDFDKKVVCGKLIEAIKKVNGA